MIHEREIHVRVCVCDVLDGGDGNEQNCEICIYDLWMDLYHDLYAILCSCLSFEYVGPSFKVPYICTSALFQQCAGSTGEMEIHIIHSMRHNATN